MYAGINLIRKSFTIDFIRWRFLSYGLSIAMVVAAVLGYFIRDLNYGIDFTGGTSIEARFATPPNIAKLRTDLIGLNIGDVAIQEFGTKEDVLIRIEQKERSNEEQAQIITQVKSVLGPDVEYNRIETVGPRMGQELITNCVQAVLWAMGAILLYIWMRFEWHFGLCAIISLIHDTFTVLILYTVFGMEFNASTIVAILITIGYSINDTVVIYDRIRENMRKYKTIALPDLLNRSINDTLSRTVLTSSATMMSLVALCLFGGNVIATYSFPILIGIAVGTYSSIWVAAPLLMTLGFKVRKNEAPAPTMVS